MQPNFEYVSQAFQHLFRFETHTVRATLNFHILGATKPRWLHQKASAKSDRNPELNTQSENTDFKSKLPPG